MTYVIWPRWTLKDFFLLEKGLRTMLAEERTPRIILRSGIEDCLPQHYDNSIYSHHFVAKLAHVSLVLCEVHIVNHLPLHSAPTPWYQLVNLVWPSPFPSNCGLGKDEWVGDVHNPTSWIHVSWTCASWKHASWLPASWFHASWISASCLHASWIHESGIHA